MLSDEAIGQLWARMAGMYGNRWTSQYGIEDDGTWAQALAGITLERISVGLERCQLSGVEWPPTLPKFRALCAYTPTELGAPDEASAYCEAVLGVGSYARTAWSHRAVYHAAYRVGSWRLRERPEAETRAAFREAYRAVLAQIASGDFVADAPALPKPAPRREHDREQARQIAERYLDELFMTLGRAPRHGHTHRRVGDERDHDSDGASASAREAESVSA